MKTSQRGIDLIKRFEGLRLTAYAATEHERQKGIWTIGYGSTRDALGRPIKQGAKLDSIAEAETLLRDTLVDYEAGVNRAVMVQMCQHQFDALVSLCYNIGVGAFSGSTLVRLLNLGDYAGAAEQILRWNKQAGKVLPGLVNRRRAEYDLFKA